MLIPMLDTSFIHEVNNITFKINKPTFIKNIINVNKKYEIGDKNTHKTTYFTFVNHDKAIYAYYRILCYNANNKQFNNTALLYSDDGINFKVPKYTKTKYDNEQYNNILFDNNIAKLFSGNFFPFIANNKLCAIGGCSHLDRDKIIHGTKIKCDNSNANVYLMYATTYKKWNKPKILISHEDVLISKQVFSTKLALFDGLQQVIYNPIKQKYVIYIRYNADSGYRKIQYRICDILRRDSIKKTHFDILHVKYNKYQFVYFGKLNNIYVNTNGKNTCNVNNKIIMYNNYIDNIYNICSMIYPETSSYISFPTYILYKDNNCIDKHKNLHSGLMFSTNGGDYNFIVRELFPDLEKPYYICPNIIVKDDKFLLYVEKFDIIVNKDKIGTRKDCGEIKNNIVKCYCFDKHRIGYLESDCGYIITKIYKLKTLDMYINYETNYDGYIQIEVHNYLTEKLVGNAINYKIKWIDKLNSDKLNIDLETSIKIYLCKAKIYSINIDV